MSKIYEQHTAAFANVSAYAVLKDGELVARIAFKFPKDGAGRLYAYVHWIGLEMVRGSTSGYGYDKRSAAVTDAVHKGAPAIDKTYEKSPWPEFSAALWHDGGKCWDDKLHDAGFTVIQAVKFV